MNYVWLGDLCHAEWERYWAEKEGLGCAISLVSVRYCQEVCAMQYETIDDLPTDVRHHLPHHPQEIYRATFNQAWAEYADQDSRQDGETQEEAAHRVAWVAVERVYTRTSDGAWVRSQ